MPPNLKLNAVAFISPQNHPIVLRAFDRPEVQATKYHYIAHTSLDVVEERVAAAGKSAECYLGLLYAMEDVAVYGYITPLKMKIIIAIPLTDSMVRDADILTIFKALHMAYYTSVSNPFLKLNTGNDGVAAEQASLLAVGSFQWKKFRRRIDEIHAIIASSANLSTS
ncbi:hypothetical protein D9619_000289 [Psilocybe cf. subviscida]|uniref:Trafficking protein particle complex subunit 2-like protein n=1 Tax=Psilocybe cf. subviscida TaxID=2480587 RepID=A0A8H5F369_9AGAR|nr:hypothetical protein D9619_000289 [Psilocybe cf. subviscida]